MLLVRMEIQKADVVIHYGLFQNVGVDLKM